MTDTTLTIILAVISGGVFGAVSALVIAWWNKPKSNAETRSLIASASKTEQDTITKWAEKYEELYKQLQDERKTREDEKNGERRSRDEERKQIESQIDDLKKEILSMQILKSAMMSQITNLQNEGLAKDKEIFHLKEIIHKHGLQITELRKGVTGQLPPR